MKEMWNERYRSTRYAYGKAPNEFFRTALHEYKPTDKALFPAESIKKNVKIPFLHIAEATGKEIKRKNIRKVLLLGTKSTMGKDFYKSVLNDIFNIEVIIPTKSDIETIHDVIYKELFYGITTSESKNKFLKIIKKSIDKGAEGVILGCTEIPLLINQNDCEIPTFDTTKIHAERAVEFSIN